MLSHSFSENLLSMKFQVSNVVRGVFLSGDFYGSLLKGVHQWIKLASIRHYSKKVIVAVPISVFFFLMLVYLLNTKELAVFCVTTCGFLT